LHSFTTNPPKGANPNGGVIRDSAGNLYGTTSAGGTGYGVVFKVNTAGKETVLYSFTGGADGGQPHAGLILDSAGNLYGTTYAGGEGGAGVVFKVNMAGQETVLYSFTGGADGRWPNAGVIRDSGGNLYGTTQSGGTANSGVVYDLNTSGQERVLYSFTGGADGGAPFAGVIRDSAGNLYGTTSSGGTVSAVHFFGAGVVYRVDPSGEETVLYSFTGGADGDEPVAGVIRDSAGTLYGTTYYGGASGWGVVYELTPAGQETALYSFAGGADGASPSAGVIRDSAGNVYGTTDYGGSAEAFSGWGVVYKVDTAGQETVLHTFTGGADGGLPYAGVIRDSAGNLYGTTISGGGAGSLGLVFRLNTSGQETVLYAFPGAFDGSYPEAGVIDSSGNFYGTTSDGGTEGWGTVFRVEASGHETVLHNFTFGDGASPNAGVIRDSAGNLYGTAYEGGTANAGVVFKVDTAGNQTVLYTFTGGADGGSPEGGVIRDSAANLYGTTYYGGTANAGVVYKLDPAGQETVLHSFTGGADGGYPHAGVILISGKLYGTASQGGASGVGVLYVMNTAGKEKVLYNFTGVGADGSYPYAGVIPDSAGNLYGTTTAGGTWGQGMVYELDAAGNQKALYDFTGLADGGYPRAGVVRDPSGNLYGTTQYGSGSGSGVVYELNVSGGVWREAVLYTFTGGADGGQPYGGVVRDSSGNLYGTTYSGGSDSTGVVFKLVP
jgi:uncharacterized repeat protein (TIGR03803 family)